ncbi:MAG: ABC-F family ATP-binding cassette domain-containing protein [Actinomycetota bacterium]
MARADGRVLIDVDGVTVTRPDRPLFAEATFTIHDGEVVGVVGRNGSGKSTLLRVVAGTQDPEAGEVRRGRDVRIVVLDQRDDLPAGTVRDVVGSGWRADAALDRLGMAPFADRPTDQLSGGQRKRVALARAMLAEGDLLLLDEPTNHLDLDGVAWLRQEIDRHRGAVVLVTHDRWLLEELATRVIDLQGGLAHVIDGGYEAHLRARVERAAKAERDETVRRNLAREELAWLRRGARARRRKPKSRIAEATQIIEGGAERDPYADDIDFAAFGTPRLGDTVIELDDVAIGYEGAPLLASGVSLKLDPRERLGIVGPNGAGKSTLVGAMTGRIEPVAGSVEHGTTAVIGELDQLGAELDPELRVRDAIAGGARQADHRDAALLDRFWFDDDSQWAPIGTLSGGERRRIQLVLTLTARPNVLVLDEPTNDLDLDTLRSLEALLDGFPGAVVVVSHDRTLLERVCDRFLVVEDGAAMEIGTGLAEWLDQRVAVGRTSEPSKPKVERTATKGSGRRPPNHLRKLIVAAELELEQLTERRDVLAEAVAAPDLAHEQRADLARKLGEVDASIEATEERWLELSAEMEG